MASAFVENRPLLVLDRRVVVDPSQHLPLVKNPASECEAPDDDTMDAAAVNLLRSICGNELPHFQA
jgi:hypothetical protein